MKQQFSPEPDEGGRAWTPYVVLAVTLLLTAIAVYYVELKAGEKGRQLFETESGHLVYIILGGLVVGIVLFWLTRAQARARAAARRAASKLRQSETRFRTLIEQSPLSTQVFSPDGRTVQVNRAWEELWGVTLETLGDYNILEDRQLVEQGIMPYIQKGFAGTPAAVPPILYDPEVTIPNISVNENPQRWVQAIIYPVRDAAGEIREVVLIHEDITERKRAEARRARRARQTTLRADVGMALAKSESLQSILHESAALLVSHFNAAFARIWTLNPDTNTLELQASAGSYTHRDGEHARVPVGQFKIGRIAEERKPHLTNDVSNDPRVSDKEWARRTGMVAFAGYPLLVEDKLIGVMAMFSREQLTEETLESLTLVAETIAQGIERKRLEEQLRQRAEQLAEANRLKDEFLATLSHELRTPLTSILGWAKLMRTEKFDSQLSNRALEIIERSAVAQSQLIDDLLDVSRIITGKLRLVAQTLDLAPIIAAAVDSLRPTADARGVQLELLLDATAGRVSGDADRLQQVIWNLLSNAIKFTPKGGRVTIELRRSGSQVEITIRDTGQGISAEFLPYIFDRFRQADGSITREHGGLGLGLAIVRHLVELHGGTIRAQSDGADLGSTFRVSLPLMALRHDADPNDGDAAARHASNTIDGTAFGGARNGHETLLKGLRVLIVDDDPDTRALLVATLEQSGAESVAAVASASEALGALARLAPDVLVSDIGMPTVDGYELIRQIRALPAEAGGRTPAAALTAYATPDDRQRALDAGYNLHIPKPVEPRELAAAVARLAGR